MRHAIAALSLALLIGSALPAATPPALVNYQGVLRDAAGAPRTGSFDMVFRFYSASTSGTLLLTDTHNTAAPSGQVAVSNGLFTAQLGAGTLAAGAEPNLAEMFRDNAAVWLEVQVGTETLAPRVRVLASAYAQNADSLDGLDASAFLTAETDPQVGTLTANRWCQADGTATAIQCTANAPADGDWTISGSSLYAAVSGNVGIGTSSPGAKLHVSAPSAPEIRVDNPTWVIGEKTLLTFMHGTRYAGINSYLPGGSDVDLQFTTTNAGTPATTMVLTGNGDLGLGTAAPAGRLEVSEAECQADQSSTLNNYGIGAFDMWQAFKPAVDGYLCRVWLEYWGDSGESFAFELYEGAGTGGTRLVFLDHLTPGASSTTITLPTPVRLTPEATYTFSIHHSGSQGWFHFGLGDPYPRAPSDSAGDYVFTTSMTYNLPGQPTLFADGGLVGIGTDAPSSRLSVDGDIEVSGSRLHVGTDGRVGIGTAAPNLPLTVQGSGTQSQLVQFKDSVGANQWHLNLQGAGLNFSESAVADYRLFIKEGGNVGIGTGTPGYQLQLSTDSAAKASTMTWTVYSDARLKRDIRPFTDGLEMLARIRPVHYRLNGLAGLPAGREGIGVIAQEMMAIAPYTVGTTRARLHPSDAAETELFDFNGSALVFALINAVRELDERTKGLADRRAAGSLTRMLGDEPRRFEGGDELAAADPAPSKVSGSVNGSGPVVQVMPVMADVESGDVLVLNPANGDELYPCGLPADPMVVGVAAAGGGFGVRGSEFGDGVGGAWLPTSSFQFPVVVGGVTLVKVDATLVPIAKGDLLTTSATSGHAMKAPRPAEQGTVVGKALEDLPAGTGLIRVLVMLR